MTRTELLEKKNKVDAALAEAVLKLGTVKRRYASTGRGVGFVEISNMQAKINRLRRESQAIQTELARINGEKREAASRTFERAFVNRAKEVLLPEVFEGIKAEVLRDLAND